jgi:hypothetical protein
VSTRCAHARPVIVNPGELDRLEKYDGRLRSPRSSPELRASTRAIAPPRRSWPERGFRAGTRPGPLPGPIGFQPSCATRGPPHSSPTRGSSRSLVPMPGRPGASSPTRRTIRVCRVPRQCASRDRCRCASSSGRFGSWHCAWARRLLRASCRIPPSYHRAQNRMWKPPLTLRPSSGAHASTVHRPSAARVFRGSGGAPPSTVGSSFVNPVHSII